MPLVTRPWSDTAYRVGQEAPRSRVRRRARRRCVPMARLQLGIPISLAVAAALLGAALMTTDWSSQGALKHRGWRRGMRALRPAPAPRLSTAYLHGLAAQSHGSKTQARAVAIPDRGLVLKWPVAGLSTNVATFFLGRSEVQDLLNWRLLSRRTRSPEACVCFVFGGHFSEEHAATRS